MKGLPKLNRRLSLEVRDDVADGAGGYAEAWVLRGTHWAEVTGRSGTGRDGEFGAEGRLRLKVTLRDLGQGHEGRPKAGDRLMDGFRRYMVDAVHEAPVAGFLVCYCREETGR